MTEPDLIVLHGEMGRPRQLRRRALAWLLPPVGWLGIFLALPMLVVLALSFATRGEHPGTVTADFSIDSYRRLAGYSQVDLSQDQDALLAEPDEAAAAAPQWFWRADTLRVFWRSLWLAVATTVLCLALALPIAFIAAQARPWVRNLLLAAVAVPFCTNMVVRVVGWELFFTAGGPAVVVGDWLGLGLPVTGLYPSVPAVLTAMISTHLGFAVLPLYASAERLDPHLPEAARDLGAGWWRTMRHGVLPQIAPGLGAATVLTFMPALGTFLITDRLGGGKTAMIGNLIQQQVGRDLPYLAALALLLVIASLLALAVYRRLHGQLADEPR